MRNPCLCRVRIFLSSGLLYLLCFLGFIVHPALAVNVWQRWDQQLQVGFDYLNGGGNPYRDLNLVVQFSGPSGASLTSYGFWDGVNAFRVRNAFPKMGNWTWRVLSCSGLTGKNSQGQIVACNSDSTLMNQQGQVNVGAANSPGNSLYTYGFLKVSGRYLTFSDSPARRFYWQGDTAWAALSLEGQKRLAQVNRTPGDVTPTWKAYVDDRSTLGFTVLQVGAAIAWQPTNQSEPVKPSCSSAKDLEFGDLTAGFPGPETFAFQQLSPPAGQSCIGAVPNNCSRWRADFWQEVDSMVEYANEKGLVVMMTGVADPADRGGCRVSQSYPRTADSVIFARNLAARLAGNHVIFSVNFDDWPGTVLDASAPTAGTVDSTTLAVGPVLKGAVPRHLIVNHLAGSSQLANYTNYQSLPWLDFQLFQSGHSAKVSVACPTKAGSTWQAKQQCAVSRAIDLTKGLRAASPLKPAVNGEGAYEDPNSGAVPPDNRYGMRHTSYASLLGGATGFTAGVNGIPPYGSLPLWSQPETLFGAHTTDGIKDMQATRALLDGIFPGSTTSWGEFVPTTPAFVDASTSTAQDDTVAGERRILTGTKDDVVLSYLPNSPTVNVIGGLSFKCVSWTAEWRDPRGVRPAAHLCPGNTRTQFSIPLGCPNRSQGDQFGSCDWIMFMRRPKNAGSGLTAVGPNETYVQVATVDPTDPVDQSGGSTTGELMAQEVTAEGIPLSSQTSIGLEDTAQNGQPIVSKIAADSQPETYWTVWEAEAGEDGTTDVFGRLVGGDGAPIGDVFQINQYLPGSQFDPFTLIDVAGNVTVIWTSLGQDGDQGGIFARRFQLSGSPGGDEFQVNVTSVGDQESARGGVDDSGDFVIAWRSGDGEIKVRMFSGTGSSRSGEIAVNSTSQGREELIDLEVDPSGEFSVHWEEYSSDDQLLGRYVRDFDADGNPLGDQVADAPQ